ncbi:MAG: hypothetical protein K2X93_01675 [Candidatus Obscuribacterales bacterium]|nr:hypothetical protein [Candidatus Obscuribacterales bacterium]
MSTGTQKSFYLGPNGIILDILMEQTKGAGFKDSSPKSANQSEGQVPININDPQFRTSLAFDLKSQRTPD